MDAFQPPISHFLVFDFANAAIDSNYENEWGNVSNRSSMAPIQMIDVDKSTYGVDHKLVDVNKFAEKQLAGAMRRLLFSWCSIYARVWYSPFRRCARFVELLAL